MTARALAAPGERGYNRMRFDLGRFRCFSTGCSASFHHLAVFSLAGILAAELALTATVLDGRTMLRLARIDAWFGLVAAVVVGAGLLRIFFAAKGFDYYVANTFFWIKMALFVAVGVISAVPTFSFTVWRRRVRADATFRPPAAEVSRMRTALYAEAALFAPDSALRRRHGSRLRHVRFSRRASFVGERHVREEIDRIREAPALDGHRGPVWSAALSPDGAHVVTASDDQTGTGVGFAGETARASSPSKAIGVRFTPPAFQPQRNPCDHRVRRRNGAGVARVSGPE